MEVKINKEIRDFTESIFFGLSMRQFFFSVLAVAAAIGVYFLLKPLLGLETASWACVLAAVPFGAMGFIKYNGMPMEKIFVAWLKDNFICPRRLTIKSNNIYKEALKGYFAKKEKEAINAQEHTDTIEAG